MRRKVFTSVPSLRHVGLGALLALFFVSSAEAQSPYATADMDPGSGGGATSQMWTCEGYAASSEPWLTADVSLWLWLDGQIIESGYFQANYWGATYSISKWVPEASYTRTITCEVYVWDLNGSAGGSVSAQIPAGCGDERTNIIEEYRAGQVNWTPTCSDFASSGGTTHFSWSELASGNGNPHYPWAIIKSILTTGLEDTRTNYNRGGIVITSGYRCPHGNAAVGGAQQSRHMWGDAADMISANYPWNFSEWTLLRNAAVAAGSTFQEAYADDPSHLHADWR